MSVIPNRIAIVDIETTGPNIELEDRIIQIAAVIIEAGEIIHEYSMFINPQRDIPKHIQLLTKINNETVKDAPTIEQVAKLWYERLKDSIFIAHNLAFDLRIMKHIFSIHQYDFDPIAIDSVTIAKVFVPDALGFNLVDLSKHFQINFSNAHNALADAKITTIIISFIANKVKKLSKDTIDKLVPYFESFDNNELIFLNNPSKFILNETDELHQINTELNEPKQDPYIQSQGSYVLQLWHENKKIIIEDKDAPISHDLMEAIIYQKSLNEPVIVVVPEINNLNLLEIKQIETKKITILKNKHQYLHLSKFKEFIKVFDISQGNQQELIIICSTIIWLESTNHGDYAEINQELNINELINKYIDNENDYSVSYFYDLALKRAQTSQVLIVSNSYFSRFIINDYQKWHQYKIIILNLSSLIKSLRKINQLELPISTMFVGLRDYLNNLNLILESEYHHQNIYLFLSNLVNYINILQETIIKYLQNQKYDVKIFQEDLEFFLSNEESVVEQLINQLEELILEFDPLIEHLTKNNLTFDGNKLLNLCMDYRNTLNQILSEIHKCFMLIQTTRINDKFYSINLYSQPYKISKKMLEDFFLFDQILIISSGLLHYEPIFNFNQWIELEDFNHINLNIYEYKQIDFNYPIEYGIESKSNAHHNQLGFFIVDYQEELNDLMIIITSNRQDVLSVYNHFINLDFFSEYLILGHSINGNGNRIRRKVIENSKIIIIMTLSQFLQEKWHDENHIADIFILRLPFFAPGKVDIRIMSEKLNSKQKMNEFNLISLPLMINNLKVLARLFAKHYSQDRIFLFDSRIYTSSYSDEVIKQVNKIINFPIWN